MTFSHTLLQSILALYGFGARRSGRRGPQPIYIGRPR